MIARHDDSRPERIDYNGHMNVACYVLAIDLATAALFADDSLDSAFSVTSEAGAEERGWR